MAQGTTPVVQQRRLRAELRRAREAAGHTQKTVANEMGWSLSKFIRMETGATNVSPADARALIQYYKITDEARVDDMLALVGEPERAWWDEYADLGSQEFLNFLAYEDSASHISQFQGLQVPGLLQTQAYARARFVTGISDQTVIDRNISIRVSRQKLLERLDEKKFEFILDEAVIHRNVGGNDVMIEQLARMKQLNELGNPAMSIRIVPFSAGVFAGMKSSFELIELLEDDEDFVVSVEEPNRDVLIRDNPEGTSHYVEAFLELKEFALSATESTEMIDSTIHRLRSDGTT